MNVRLPDGTIIQNVPEGTTKVQLLQKLHANGHDIPGYMTQAPTQDAPAVNPFSLNTDRVEAVGQGIKNAAGGFVRSGMGIVSNLMRPIDALTGANDPNLSSLITGKPAPTAHEQRMARVDARFRNKYGINPDSTAFQAGKLGGDIAATAPIGGFLANGMRAVPMLAKFAPAVQSGGFSLGDAATGSALKNTLLRAGGGAVQGGAAAGLVNPADAPSGAMIGGMIPGVAAAGGKVGEAARQWLDDAAHKTMTRALKPTLKMHQTGQADTAVQMMLDHGINATPGGVEKIQNHISQLNQQIEDIIQNSSQTVNRSDILAALDGTRGKFMNQVDPMADVSAINGVADRFSAHPYFQQIEAQGVPLKEAVDTATLGKTQALQAAGKLKTFAAQQENLAHGGSVNLSPVQPENQLYMNAGKTGGNALSPSAYPVPFMPRVAGKYTNNLDRVPEGNSGYQDAMAAYEKRKADELAAQSALDNWQRMRGTIPVQQAQQMKQGTYRVLNGKYGEAGSAETEAQKALARGLKDQIARVEPGVAIPNALESRFLDTLKVAQRRANMAGNNSKLGLSALAPKSVGALAFLIDRNPTALSLLARSANKTGKSINQLALPDLMRQYGLLGAPSVALTSSR